MLKHRLCVLLVLASATMPVAVGCTKRSSDKPSFLLLAAKNTAPTVKGTATTLALVRPLIERTYIKGNEQTHYFEIMAGSTNDGSGAAYHNWASIQGAGYSKGDGQHFLVYYRGTNGARDQNGVVGPGTAGGYYCISANTTKALFGSAIYANPIGYTADTVPADCATFGATVAAMPRWEIADYATVNPTSSDYPLTTDSALFIGTGDQKLGLAL